MQLIDDKYRLFGVINLIDLVFVLAVFAGGYAVYHALAPTAPVAPPKATNTVNYDVFCPGTRNVDAGEIKVGDTISRTNGKVIGKVTAVRMVPTRSEIWDSTTQKAQLLVSTLRSDIYISCSARGRPTATGFAVGDVQLRGNQPMPVFTSTFQCDSATIANLKIIGN